MSQSSPSSEARGSSWSTGSPSKSHRLTGCTCAVPRTTVAEVLRELAVLAHVPVAATAPSVLRCALAWLGLGSVRVRARVRP